MTRPSSIGSAFLLVSLAALLLVLPSCRRMSCSDHVGQSVVSPDGKYVATVLQSECLAREHATVVELRRNRFLLKDPRIVFLIGGFRDISVCMAEQEPACDHGSDLRA